MKSVAIIGGGFSGLMSAVHLTRMTPTPLHIHIVNPEATFPLGVAYSTPYDWHVLNVRAFNMSAYPDNATHFVSWLRKLPAYRHMEEDALRIQFIPRATYGNYLKYIWENLQEEVRQGGLHEITCHHTEATDISPDAHHITLKNGIHISADFIILATGHSSPTNPPQVTTTVAQHPAYCENPWAFKRLSADKNMQDVLILGSGLTMVDTVLTLLHTNHTGRIYFSSRKGLLPISHGAFIKNDFLTMADIPSPRLVDVIALCKSWMRKFREEGKPDFLAVDKFRPITQELWQGFNLHEKKYFLRFLRTPWNVARHRIADEVAQTLENAMRNGNLTLLQKRVQHIEIDGDDFNVHVGGQSAMHVGTLINCTGPRDSYADATNPLIRAIIEKGIGIADELDMGFAVNSDFALINDGDKAHQHIYATGVLIKGTYWESFAVPDLRKQVQQMCQNITEQIIRTETNSTNQKTAALYS